MRSPFYPVLLVSVVLIAFCLVGFQAPPPTEVGDGVIEVQVSTATGTPVRGLTVRYVDEWQREEFGRCTTDAQGQCRITLTDVPALGQMLRGALDVGSGRLRDAMLMVGEQVTVRVTLDAEGEVQVGTDVLATRDPNVTPTMLSVESAFATLTAVAAQPIATPSVGIERTVAAAHAAMTATSTHGVRVLTPSPRYTPTPTGTLEGIAVAQTPVAFATPEPTLREDAVNGIGYLIALAVVGLLVAIGLWFWWGWRQQQGRDA
jgi:hypothetical protein